MSPKSRPREVLKSNPFGLKLLLLNAKTVNNKVCLIWDLILNENTDIVCITETWLGAAGGVILPQLCQGAFRYCTCPGFRGRVLVLP